MAGSFFSDLKKLRTKVAVYIFESRAYAFGVPKERPISMLAAPEKKTSNFLFFSVDAGAFNSDRVVYAPKALPAVDPAKAQEKQVINPLVIACAPP